MEDNKLTCVYCGMAYPAGTPTHGARVLTEHIKVCEKHPMRKAEDKIFKLRAALAGLVGASTKKELQDMEAVIRSANYVPESEKVSIINAIDVLIDTVD